MALEIRILRAATSTSWTMSPMASSTGLWTRLRAEFLRDPRHHLSVGIEDGVVVGFASAVHYVHPDKPPQLWINEVAVAPSHQRKGIAKAVSSALMAVGRALGCTEAWVLTDEGNVAARALYQSAGGMETTHIMVIVSAATTTMIRRAAAGRPGHDVTALLSRCGGSPQRRSQGIASPGRAQSLGEARRGW